ncbi:unnamed protein product [Owenia fusiformis]|uniref:X-box-binding protein 1 n=1 Tax=Owenia fusiformis TaxID=6347 RepID=A0A8S4Q837_OWEFU|nr:unnamed protein product [Owenia fusiformis]
MVAQHTILVTTMPGKKTQASLASLNLSPTQFSQAESLLHDMEPKKRRRLTHLTPDEKIMRRKLKNRVAAQTARDRKKVRMDTLEQQLSDMETLNKQLVNENNRLKTQTSHLKLENAQLRERLGMQVTGDVDVEIKKEPVLPESAVLSPPQQDRVQALYKMTMSFISVLAILSLTYGWTSSPKLKTPKRLTKSLRPLKPSPSKKTPTIWWGPQQKSWNPSMNL